jgi:hypothetical protein
MLVVHGGALPNPNADGSIDWKVDGQTLGWDGKTWRVLSVTGPSPRDHHAMVYDAARKKIVLYGGGDADPSGRADYFGDTWEWDGKAWTRITDAGPGTRVHHAMAYDPCAGRQWSRRLRTWRCGRADVEWDGKTWQDRGESEVALRVSPRIAFDDSRKKIVLFGGDIRDATPRTPMNGTARAGPASRSKARGPKRAWPRLRRETQGPHSVRRSGTGAPRRHVWNSSGGLGRTAILIDSHLGTEATGKRKTHPRSAFWSC